VTGELDRLVNEHHPVKMNKWNPYRCWWAYGPQIRNSM